MKRHTIALSLTSSIYLFIGAIFCYQNTVFKQPITEPLTSVAISLYTPKEAPLEEPQHQEVAPKTPEPKSLPLQEHPKPSKPKPVLKKETMVEPPKESFAISEESLQQPISTQTSTTEVSQESIKMHQKNYLESLRKRINEHKIYPRIAQTSHIEGNVKVEFTISPKGELLSFVILEGKKIFHKATEEAIQKSFPFPLNEDLFTSSMTFQIELNYTLL